MPISDAFGYWLAGFADGEGCFTITPNRPGYLCRFAIGLRQDDSEILREILERTAIGKILCRPPHTKDGANRQALTLWRVQTKADCQALVLIFERYPLRTKKARDFVIWREAVLAMSRMEGSTKPGCSRDWSHVGALKERLADTRRYRLLHVPGVEAVP